MKVRVFATAVCLLLALGSVAEAKGNEIARLREPSLVSAQPGTAITVSWILVDPDDDDRPLNACGVFVQLTSASGAAPTRSYADAPRGKPTSDPSMAGCRSHMAGQYEATVLVPEGGMGSIQIGLSGTTDVFFPVVGLATGSAPAGVPSDLPLSLGLIGVVIAVAGTAAVAAARRRVLAR